MKFATIALACLFMTFSTIKSGCNNNCGRRFYEVETVCGFNGVTYKNPCFARCNDAQIAYYGACSEENVPCGCPQDSNNVCDLNGDVHLNECVANCKGLVAIPLSLCQGSTPTLQDNDDQVIPLVVRDKDGDGDNVRENAKNYNYRDIDYDDVDPMNLYYGVDIVNFYQGRHGKEFTGVRRPERRNAGEAS